jgi:hypothetical protein
MYVQDASNLGSRLHAEPEGGTAGLLDRYEVERYRTARKP